MQKKLIALAVAAISAAPAFAADTSVTLYGLIDMGYTLRSSNVDTTKSSRGAFDSGIGNGSRIGVKGVEDLGGGLKAVFQLEGGINVDQGSSAQSGLTWGRQSYVGIDTGSAGVITIGRQYNPLYDYYSGGGEPFTMGNVGQLNNIFTHATTRYSNALRYKSPWFGDVFSVDALYSKATGEEAVANAADKRAYVLLPRVKFGPVVAFASYQQVKTKDATKSDKVFDLGGTVDFKVVKLSAAYARVNYEASPIANKDTGNGITITAPKHNRFFIGASAPMGAFTLRASYAMTKSKSDSATWSRSSTYDGSTYKAQQFALGGRYAVSKRTDFYATYSTINGNAAGSTYTVGDGSNSGNGYKRAFDLGVRHTF